MVHLTLEHSSANKNTRVNRECFYYAKVMLPGFKLVDPKPGWGCQIWDLAAGNIEMGNRQFDGRDRFIFPAFGPFGGFTGLAECLADGRWEMGDRRFGIALLAQGLIGGNT